jgi:outer membrane scaffolding protein for murein synthesis (MipA/OmpV family)
MLVATSVGLLVYQWQMPFGKTAQTLPLADNEQTNELLPTTNKEIVTAKAENTVEAQQSTTATTTATAASTSKSNIATPPATPIGGSKLTNENAAPIKATALVVKNDESTQKEAEKTTETPGIAPKTDESDANGQRPENSNNYPVLTRRVEVTHAFSESYLKWRNQNMQSIQIQASGNNGKPAVDTPIIILNNPFNAPQKAVKFGVSAGVNTKVYNSDRFSVTPVLGAFVRKRLDSRYAIQADLQYKLLLNQSFSPQAEPQAMQMEVDVDPSNEVLFEQRTAKVYDVRRMHLLELPVSFIYQLHKRHNVSLGMNVAYLFGVKTNNRTINQLSGREMGFNSLDLGALAGYEFGINEHLSLSVYYNVGFLNLARNAGARQQYLANNTATSFQFDDNQQQVLSQLEECLMPVEVSEDEQIFLQTPNNLYNSDLRILLRYFF